MVKKCTVAEMLIKSLAESSVKKRAEGQRKSRAESLGEKMLMNEGKSLAQGALAPPHEQRMLRVDALKVRDVPVKTVAFPTHEILSKERPIKPLVGQGAPGGMNQKRRIL